MGKKLLILAITIAVLAGSLVTGPIVFAQTILFSDDFSGASPDWQQSGTRILVNTATDVIDWDAKATDTLPQGVSHDLGAEVLSSTDWTLRGKFTVDQQIFQTSNSAQMFIGIFAEDHSKKADSSTTGWHGIYVQYTMDGGTPPTGVSLVSVDDSPIAAATPSTATKFAQSTADTPGVISVGTHYFEIKRTSTTTAEASIYTDASFTNLVETITINLPAGLTEDLRYVMIKAWDNAEVIGGAWDGTIDDIELTHVLPEPEPDVIGDILSQIQDILASILGLDTRVTELEDRVSELEAKIDQFHPAVTLTVQATDTNEDTRSLWTVLQLDGTTVGNGLTTKTYEITTGTVYTISVSNYNQYTFIQWEDGSTENPRTFSVSGDTTFTALFNAP